MAKVTKNKNQIIKALHQANAQLRKENKRLKEDYRESENLGIEMLLVKAKLENRISKQGQLIQDLKQSRAQWRSIAMSQDEIMSYLSEYNPNDVITRAALEVRHVSTYKLN